MNRSRQLQEALQEAFQQAIDLAGYTDEHPVRFDDGDDSELMGLSPAMRAIASDVANELFDEFAEECGYHGELLIALENSEHNRPKIESKTLPVRRRYREAA